MANKMIYYKPNTKFKSNIKLRTEEDLLLTALANRKKQEAKREKIRKLLKGL